MAGLLAVIALEQLEHPGRGHSADGHERASQRVLARRDWLASFLDFPDACLTMFRFTFAEIQQMSVDLATELHTPRLPPVNAVAAHYRALTVDDSNRIAILLAQCANPHIRLDNWAMHLGIADGTLSKMLHFDRASVIRGLRGELPAIIHPAVIVNMLKPLGSMPNARVLVDTTDTRIQDLVGAFNAHHKFPSIKPLVFVDGDSRLLGAETGWGGNESDLSIFEQSKFFAQIAPSLQPGQRLFVGDTAFRHSAIFYPLSEKIELKNVSQAQLPAFRLYNRQLQLYRARVEHAIGLAKHHWGAIKEVPGIYHMALDDIVNMIFLSWLFEARWQRLRAEHAAGD